MVLPSQTITVAVNLSSLDQDATASVTAVSKQMIVGTAVVQGPAGPTGPQGPTGATGATGATGPAGSGVIAGGTANQALTKINSTDGNVQWSTIDKTFVGLSNVDNTSDVNKPVSTAQTTAINAKVADAINDGTTTVAPSQNAVFDALALKQPLDSDLTTIAGLTPTTDNFMVAASSAWASRTPSQAKTSLALVKGDVGLGNVDNTSDATKNSATATLTNKRVTPRVGTTTSSATPTINTDNVDVFTITALAVNITSMTTNLSGTPTDSQKFWVIITGTATRTVAWGASFEDGASSLPTTTSGTTRLDTFLVWNAVTSKWRCMSTSVSSSGGTGDVVGPASSTDNAVARFDGTTGKLLQDSTATLSDTGDMVATTITTAVTGAGAGTPVTATIDSSVATQSAILAKNATNFAHNGNIIKAQMLNASDTGDVIRIENSGTGKNVSSRNGTTETFYVAKDGTTYVATAIELGAASDTTLSRSAAGVMAVEGVVVPTISSTNTFTNKRITKRETTLTSSATPTFNTDTCDLLTITALAANITSMTTNMTGTPTDGQEFWVRIKGDATPRTVSWGANFQSSGVATLLATTAASKTHMSKFIYDSDVAKFVCMAVDAVGY